MAIFNSTEEQIRKGLIPQPNGNSMYQIPAGMTVNNSWFKDNNTKPIITNPTIEQDAFNYLGNGLTNLISNANNFWSGNNQAGRNAVAPSPKIAPSMSNDNLINSFLGTNTRTTAPTVSNPVNSQNIPVVNGNNAIPTNSNANVLTPAMAGANSPDFLKTFFSNTTGNSANNNSSSPTNTLGNFTPVVDNSTNSATNQRDYLNNQFQALIDNYNNLAPNANTSVDEFLVGRGIRSGIRNQISQLSPVLNNLNSIVQSDINNQNQNNLTNIRDLRDFQLSQERLNNDTLNTNSLINSRESDNARNNATAELNLLNSNSLIGARENEIARNNALTQNTLANDALTRGNAQNQLSQTAGIRDMQTELNNTLKNGYTPTISELNTALSSPEGKIRIDQLVKGGMTQDNAKKQVLAETRDLLGQQKVANLSQSISIASNPGALAAANAKQGNKYELQTSDGLKIEGTNLLEVIKNKELYEKRLLDAKNGTANIIGNGQVLK